LSRSPRWPVDAMLQGSVKIADALEEARPYQRQQCQQGPMTFSRPLAPAPGVKSVDPYDISIVMPAEDGEPVGERRRP